VTIAQSLLAEVLSDALLLPEPAARAHAHLAGTARTLEAIAACSLGASDDASCMRVVAANRVFEGLQGSPSQGQLQTTHLSEAVRRQLLPVVLANMHLPGGTAAMACLLKRASERSPELEYDSCAHAWPTHGLPDRAVYSAAGAWALFKALGTGAAPLSVAFLRALDTSAHAALIDLTAAATAGFEAQACLEAYATELRVAAAVASPPRSPGSGGDHSDSSSDSSRPPRPARRRLASARDVLQAARVALALLPAQSADAAGIHASTLSAERARLDLLLGNGRLLYEGGAQPRVDAGRVSNLARGRAQLAAAAIKRMETTFRASWSSLNPGLAARGARFSALAEAGRPPSAEQQVQGDGSDENEQAEPADDVSVAPAPVRRAAARRSARVRAARPKISAKKRAVRKPKNKVSVQSGKRKTLPKARPARSTRPQPRVPKRPRPKPAVGPPAKRARRS